MKSIKSKLKSSYYKTLKIKKSNFFVYSGNISFKQSLHDTFLITISVLIY